VRPISRIAGWLLFCLALLGGCESRHSECRQGGREGRASKTILRRAVEALQREETTVEEVKWALWELQGTRDPEMLDLLVSGLEGRTPEDCLGPLAGIEAIGVHSECAWIGVSRLTSSEDQGVAVTALRALGALAIASGERDRGETCVDLGTRMFDRSKDAFDRAGVVLALRRVSRRFGLDIESTLAKARVDPDEDVRYFAVTDEF
jgi:hypothetical protein